MNNTSLPKAGLVAMLVVILAIGGWELYLRSKGIAITYDDGPELWSEKRRQVYLPADRATVFIGSSRNKFDIDIDTWEQLTGEKALQLAEEGSSPRPILHDLAMDPKFRGKLMIDVTEPMFFSPGRQVNIDPDEDVHYYKTQTPAQRAGFLINTVLESQFTFLDKNYLSLHNLIEQKSTLKNRPGVFTMPYPCPIEFNRVSFDRQDIMTQAFETDTALQNHQVAIWNFYRSLGPKGPLPSGLSDSISLVVKQDVDAIVKRGGTVIVVRSPSSGPNWKGEQMGFPRPQYWDKLLTVTRSKGIHFADYPAISGFICPETSHLKRSDAVIYTKELIRILSTEKGWSFPFAPKSTTLTYTAGHGL